MIKRSVLNVTKTYILFSSIIPILLIVNQSFGQYSKVEQLTNCYTISIEDMKSAISNTTIAASDTFEMLVNCKGNMLCENVLENDNVLENKTYKVCFVYAPVVGELTFGSNGSFTYTVTDNFIGIVRFSYVLCELDDDENKQKAEVVIYVRSDFDCDLLADEYDLDDDNDGILDIDEGDGQLDSDLDGFPDSFDIDSDNDGIPDNIEWQKEGEFVAQLESDSNKNGWDDAFDITSGGTYYEPVDTDKNGIPDFLDIDSDNDAIFDYIEAFDENNDGIPDIEPKYCDTDKDGLDDAYDITECWSLGCNSAGSNCLLTDANKNGIRDWRDAKIVIPDDNTSQEFTPDVFIYPNPSQGLITVYIPTSDSIEQYQLTIYNIQGKLILQQDVKIGKNYINMELELSGVYFVKIISNSFHYHQQISKF